MKKYILFLFLFVSCSVVENTNNPIGIGITPKFSDLTPTSDYVIYSDCATLPILYSGIHMFTHTKPSYMYMGRAGTLNLTKLPSHVNSISDVEKMRTKIADINRANPKATFTLYANDLRAAKAFKYFYSQGISKNRVKVILLTDGTQTYKQFSDIYGDSLAYNTWKRNEIIYDREFNKNPKPNLDINFFWESKDNKGAFLTVPLIANNTYIWMQWPELLVSDSSDLRNYLSKSAKRYYKVDPLKYYKSLTISKQDNFITLVGLDKKWAFNEGNGTLKDQTIEEALDASPKENIIITGTVPYGNTDEYIAKVKAYYGTGYDYFFKGHPRETTHPSDKDIVVFPFQLPMETIIWTYENKISIIGGHDGSLYMNVPKEMKKFFFNQKSDGSTLVSPLDIMFKQGWLGEVKFF